MTSRAQIEGGTRGPGDPALAALAMSSRSASARLRPVASPEACGIKGYWRRPKRKLSKILGKLTLLLRVQPETRYKHRFDYNGVIARSFRQNAAQADFRPQPGP